MCLFFICNFYPGEPPDFAGRIEAGLPQLIDAAHSHMDHH